MRYHEPADHPAKRNRPDCVVNLSVYQSEWAAMKAIFAKHGPVQIIAVEQVPIIPVFEIEVLCQSPQSACALDNAWMTYTETSPHRPHSMEEALAWGEQFNPIPNLPREWRF
jgi:hypothetical protein